MATRRGPDVQVGLLESLTPGALSELTRSATTVRWPAGTTIFVQDDPGDAVYLIQSGLVDILSGKPDAPDRIATLGPGEVLGEQSLLTGRRRSATAIAQTGVTLWRIDHEDFLSAIAAIPELGTAVASTLSERLQSASRRQVGSRRGQTVLMVCEDLTCAARVITPLVSACSRLVGEESVVLVSDKAGLEDGALPDAAQAADEDRLVGIAVRAVRDYPLVFIVCGSDPPPVLLEGSDRVVRLTHDGYDRRGQVAGDRGTVAVSAELDGNGITALARQICGRRVGLALGAGAIRGFAHAGVLGVLSERGVPMDLVSGSSAGAIAGALFLSGWPPRELASLLAASLETIQTGLPSLTVPPGSLLTGRRLLNYFRRKLGPSTHIEDLPVPFIVAATDLEHREAVHLDSGPLAESIAASSAVPGVFPPVGLGGRRLVDGGVSDPVPVRALRERGADIVVAVNVMGVGTGTRAERPRLLNLPVALESVLVLPGLLSNLLLGLDVIMSQIALDACRWADVVISPSCPPSPRHRVVPAQTYRDAGERAALEAMPELTAVLGPAVG